MPQPKGSRNKPQSTGVYRYVPATFDVRLFTELRGREDAAHWLLDKVITLAHRQKHNPFFNGFSEISRRTMRQFIGDAASVEAVRTAMIAGNVLVCNESYLPTSAATKSGREPFPMSYAIHPDHAGELKRVEIGSAVMASKIRAYRLALVHLPVSRDECDRTQQYLIDNLRQVRIDTRWAYEIIDKQPDPPAQVKRVRIGKKGRKRFVEVAVCCAKSLCRMTVDAIAAGDLDTVFDPYGRFHNPFTRLLTECRQALGIDGEPLVGVDIKNSQVVFLLLLLLEHRHHEYGYHQLPRHTHSHPSLSHSGRKYSLSPNQEAEPDEATRATASSAATTSARVMSAALSQDEEQFQEDVLDGSLYDRLMLKLGYTDRRTFKGDFFREVLYGDPKAWYVRHGKVAQAFRQQYPTVWAFIVERKRTAYEELARDMQRRESRFVLGSVCKRLAEHHPWVTVVTVHDSIMCVPQHLPLVKRIVAEEFERLGVSPAVHEITPQPLRLAA
jgi:hypothetical protein